MTPLPKTRTVHYEEWLRMRVVEEGHLRCSAIVADGVLTPRHFPSVTIEITHIWPD